MVGVEKKQELARMRRKKKVMGEGLMRRSLAEHKNEKTGKKGKAR